MKAKIREDGKVQEVELGKHCGGSETEEVVGWEGHLGLGPVWTSCHTCSIVCLASTNEESKGVAICYIMPFSSVLQWGFSCQAKCTAKAF